MLTDSAAQVVFLHGMLGSPGMWRGIAAGFSARTGVASTSITLPWHGLEPWGSEIGDFDCAALAIGERLPPGPIVLVGYSLGGRLALAVASQNKAVRAVIAIGAHLGLHTETERAARQTWERDMARLARERGMSGLVDVWEALPVFASQTSLPDAERALERAARLAHRPDAIARAFEVLGTGSMPLLEARLRACNVAVVLLAGALDVSYVEANRHAAASLGATAVVIPGVGHNVALEAPALLTQLIAEQPSLAPSRVKEPKPAFVGERRTS